MNRIGAPRVARVTVTESPGHVFDFNSGYDRVDILCPQGVFPFYPYTPTMDSSITRYASAEAMLMRDKIASGPDTDATIARTLGNAMRIKPVDKPPENEYLGNIEDSVQWL